MDEIIEFNNEKFLIERKHKIFQNNDLFNKIKFNTGSDIVLQKDGIFYFCKHIDDAIEVKDDDSKNEIQFDNSCSS